MTLPSVFLITLIDDQKKYTKQSQEIRKEPLLTWSMMNVLLDSLLALKILWLCIFSPKRGKREEQLITKRILHFSQLKLKPFASKGIKEIILLLLNKRRKNPWILTNKHAGSYRMKLVLSKLGKDLISTTFLVKVACCT